MHEPNFLERVKQIVRVLREAGPEEGRTDPAETFRFMAKLAEVRVAEATGFEVTGEPVEQAPGEGYVRLRVPLEQAGGGPAVATSRLRTGRSARSSSPSTKQPQDHERAQLLGTGPQRRPPGECPEFLPRGYDRR